MIARVSTIVASLLLLLTLSASIPLVRAQSGDEMPTPTGQAIRFAEPADLNVHLQMVFVVARFASAAEAETARKLVVADLRASNEEIHRATAPNAGDTATLLTNDSTVAYLAIRDAEFVHIWDIEAYGSGDISRRALIAPLVEVAETVFGPDHLVPDADECQSDLLDRLPHEEDMPDGWLADEEELRYDDLIAGCEPAETPVAGSDHPLPEPIGSASRMYLPDNQDVIDQSRIESFGFYIFLYRSAEEAMTAMAIWDNAIIEGEGLEQVRMMEAPSVGDEAMLFRGHTNRTLGGRYDTAFLVVREGPYIHVWKSNGLRAAAGPSLLTDIATDWFAVEHVTTGTISESALLSLLPGDAEAPEGYSGLDL
jgi:hypothetical protein